MTDAVIGLMNTERGKVFDMNDGSYVEKAWKKSIKYWLRMKPPGFPAFFKSIGWCPGNTAGTNSEENYSIWMNDRDLHILPQAALLYIQKQGSPPFFDSDNKYELLFTESPVQNDRWHGNTEIHWCQNPPRQNITATISGRILAMPYHLRFVRRRSGKLPEAF